MRRAIEIGCKKSAAARFEHRRTGHCVILRQGERDEKEPIMLLFSIALDTASAQSGDAVYRGREIERVSGPSLETLQRSVNIPSRNR